MTTAQQIQNNRSKANCKKIALQISESKEQFKTLMALIFDDNETFSWRYAWVAEMVIFENNALLYSYIDALLKQLPLFKHNGSRRSISKLFTFIEIPEKYSAIAFDVFLGLLLHPKEAVAVRVHAMQNLFNLALHYPDLIPEVTIAIEDQMERNSVAFKARARQLLKKLSKVKVA